MDTCHGQQSSQPDEHQLIFHIKPLMEFRTIDDNLLLQQQNTPNYKPCVKIIGQPAGKIRFR